MTSVILILYSCSNVPVPTKEEIATAFLLQSATRFITNCDRYYKVRWIYYKLRQVLQSAMIITNCDSTNPPSHAEFLSFKTFQEGIN